MRYLSVCSGIEAASVAWRPLGFSPVGFAENDKFPSDVLEQHFPGVENFGDMNGFQGWPKARVDVLVGGTPCQSFSVAGLRQGMADPRGNLALVYLAIASRYRPRWLVWENVPGVLSSDEGRDFGAIIGAMGKLGYGVAYRVLDAQYFGVPQRRRRVFLVGHLGDWRRAAQVLFESESLRRNNPPSRRPGQDVAGTLTRSALDGSSPCGGDGRDGLMLSETTPPLTHKPHGDNSGREESLIPEVSGPLGSFTGGFRTTDFDGHGAYIPDVANPLTARMHKGINTTLDEGQTPIVTHDIAAPLTAGSAKPGTNAPGRRQEDDENIVACFDETQITHPENRSSADPATAHLSASARPPSLAFEPRYARNGRGAPDVIAPPLKAQSGRTGKGDGAACVYGSTRVRRLTPTECERLQGFPDGWTDIPGASDTARYRALGNSMAVPVMRWIGDRINAQQ